MLQQCLALSRGTVLSPNYHSVTDITSKVSCVRFLGLIGSQKLGSSSFVGDKFGWLNNLSSLVDFCPERNLIPTSKNPNLSLLWCVYFPRTSNTCLRDKCSEPPDHTVLSVLFVWNFKSTFIIWLSDKLYSYLNYSCSGTWVQMQVRVLRENWRIGMHAYQKVYVLTKYWFCWISGPTNKPTKMEKISVMEKAPLLCEAV